MKRTIIIVAVLAAALAGFYWLTHYRAAQKAALESTPQEATVIKVRVINPTEETIHEKVSFVGNIEAEETVPVYPKLKDLTITSINVHVGDRVEEGDVLARLDNSLMSTSLQQARQGVATAEANVRLSESTFQTQKRDYDRYESLVADGVVSKQEFDRIENQYRIAEETRKSAQFALADAKAALSNVRINMGYHSVVAPASGIISERNADPGDKSDSDGAMFVVSRQDRLKLTGSVPESAFMKLELGAPATVTAEALPGDAFKASVTRIYPTIDVATRSGKVELGIDAKGVLKPGLYAQGTIEMGEHKGIVLPREVVRPLRGSPHWRVFLLRDDGTVEARTVTTGVDLGNRVEITAGVAMSDRVIATQSERLEEQNVRVEVVD